ncbi:MAG: hypothetical protein QNJ97_16710 [Myxococcota bacterium]|nr:hypothetical protein [Myxococcota bacterium]
MRRNTRSALVAAIAVTILALGCIDRPPAPQCPVPIEVGVTKDLAVGFDGVDLLVVVDNSLSMEQEQNILATGFFTLINALAKPIIGPEWPFPAVENMRVAIVSSDMGLQYGDDGHVDDAPDYFVPKGCEGDGDDGKFLTKMPESVDVKSGVIACESDGDQCPAGFSCDNEVCVSSQNPSAVDCPGLNSDDDFAETSKDNANNDLATQVACMSQLDTEGCGVEQQLQAAVRALSRKGQGSGEGGFLKETHLLAILTVSDEEDCSVRDPGLYTTQEWESGTSGTNGLLNVACNYPEDNETDYLFEPNVYWDKFVKFKDDEPKAVVFAAIVGVPLDDVCQGQGSDIDACLDHEKMQLKLIQTGVPETTHFEPACTREVGEGDEAELVTEARPGRRYVQLAKKFAKNGYVYSICNEDWSPAMRDIAQVIAKNMQPQCYAKRLEWTREEDDQDDSDCENCGKAKCDVIAVYDRMPGAEEGCPEALDVPANQVATETVDNPNGSGTVTRHFCRVPKLLAPIKCSDAQEMYKNTSEVGWYYCETKEENNDVACDDGWDNDADGMIDCSDTDDDANGQGCGDCEICGGTGIDCKSTCPYALQLTGPAQKIVRGQMLEVHCLQQVFSQDENCQENTEASCNDGEDNDGNGVYDCIQEEDHFADLHCCPLDIDKEKNECKPTDAYEENCPGEPVIDSAGKETACMAHARALGCTLIKK